MRLPWFENLVMRVPARTFHTLVFGAGLTALTRVLLAWLTEQTTSTMEAGYAVAIMAAFVLSKNTSRMGDRTPRLVTSSFSLTTFAVAGTVPVEPTARSNQLAAATIAFLAVGTVVGELLHRLTGRSEPAEAQAAVEQEDNLVAPVKEVAMNLDKAVDSDDALRQLCERAGVR